MEKQSVAKFYLIIESSVQIETYQFRNIFSMYIKQCKNIAFSGDASQ